MWYPTLSLALLLTAANLISGAALPPSLPILKPQTPGLPSLNCRRIPSSPPAVRPLPKDRNPTTARSLSPRVLPYCLQGVLVGGQRSEDFPLQAGHTWILYWTDERLVLGGEVELWKVERLTHRVEMVDSTPMANRELNPFMPQAGWDYYIEFRGASMGRISWYMTTEL